MASSDHRGEHDRSSAPVTAGAPYHAVQFYDNEKSLARIVGEFLAAGMVDGHPAIVVASASQRGAILRELVNRRLDVVRLQGAGALLLLDAQGTMDRFMVEGKPDPIRFKDQMCGVITQACRGRAACTIRIYGQMVDLLWKQGHPEAALRLEMLWNQVATSEAFALLCGYAMGHFYKDVHFNEICRQHTHVVAESGEQEKVTASTLRSEVMRGRADDRTPRAKRKRR